jgi:hypothetical protein
MKKNITIVLQALPITLVFGSLFIPGTNGSNNYEKPFSN